MPLRKDSKRRSDTADSDSKTVDAVSTKDCQHESDYYEKEKEDDDDETQDAWLESLGVENSEIKKINHSQVRIKIVHSQFIFIFGFILGENDFGKRKRSR